MQLSHGVAMVQSSATKITNAAIYYHCATSLYYAHWFVRESWLWHVLLPRLNSDSYHDDALQYAKQIFFISFPFTTKYCIMRECENIIHGYLYVCDLAFVILKGIHGFKVTNRFLEISCRDLTTSLTSSLFTILLNCGISKSPTLIDVLSFCIHMAECHPSSQTF
jgi:hypothetical protein